MDYRLAKEIYGRTVWAVDGETFSSHLKMIQDFRNGVVYENPVEKLNSTFIYNVLSGTKVISETWQRHGKEEHDLVYVVNLDGPITRNGGSSSYGTKDLASKIKYFEALPNVKGGIILANSGGGSTNAVEIINSAVEERTKPIIALLEKGALACSACYGSIVSSDYIMSDGKNNKVGSIGTMADFEGVAHKNKDQDGVKTIRVYATKSTAKNKWYEEAVNNDNFEPLISEILDPENEIFISEIKKARPQILETQLDGSVYKSGDVVGTLIDGFGTFSDAVNMVLELSSTKYSKNKNNNKPKINSKMNKETLKSDHPEVYSAILAEGKAEGIKVGIEAEKDRCGSWLAHAENDLEAVKAGIAGGGSITATARENFLVKAANKNKLNDLKVDSAEEVTVDESKGEKPKTEAELFYADVTKNL